MPLPRKRLLWIGGATGLRPGDVPGIDLQLHPTLDAAVGWEAVPLLAVDFDHLQRHDRLTLLQAQRARNNARTLMLFATGETAALGDLVNTHTVAHLMRKPDGRADPAELRLVLEKLVAPRFAGLRPHLSAPGAEIRERVLKNGEDKEKLLTEIRGFGEGKAVHPRFLSLLVEVAEELLSNALQHALGDGRGPRSHVRMDVQFGSDGKALGICVKDSFGGFGLSAACRAMALAWSRRASQQV
ncbi:MAG: hypothetical protein ACT4TC_07230, partial [Myxococcaceae bacterium]